MWRARRANGWPQRRWARWPTRFSSTRDGCGGTRRNPAHKLEISNAVGCPGRSARAARCVAGPRAPGADGRAAVACIGTPAKAKAPGEARVERFAAPVIGTYGRQARLVAEALAGSPTLAASPPMDSDLSRVNGADVFVVFVESYGAIGFDRPALAERLAAGRGRFDAAIRQTGRRVVSAFVPSPTFRGSS